MSENHKEMNEALTDSMQDSGHRVNLSVSEVKMDDTQVEMQRRPTPDLPSKAAIAAVGDSNQQKFDQAKKQLSTSDRISIGFVFFSVFIDLFGLSVVQPILPFYAERFGANSTELGLMYSGYALFGLLSSNFFGYLSDRFGRKPAILFSIFGSSLGYFLAAQATSYYFLLISRMVGGFFSSSMPVAQAAITDVVDELSRPKFLAALGSIVALSFVIGPGIGSGLAEFGLTVPFYVSGCMALLGFLMSFVLLRETHPKFAKQLDEPSMSQSSITSTESMDELSDEQVIVPIPCIVYIVGIFIICTMIAFTSYFSMFALFMQARYGWGSLQIGFASLVFALFLMVGQIASFNTLNGRYGLTATSIIGSVVSTIILVVTPLPENMWGTLAFTSVLLPIGIGTIMPATTSLLANYSHPTNRGKTLGMGQMFSTSGMVIGPLASGALFSIDIRLPFWLGAGATLLGGLIVTGTLLAGYDKCGPPGQTDDDEVDTNTDWVWVPDEPTEEDYAKLGHSLGELLTRHNYKWVKYFDHVMDTMNKIFPPVRVTSLKDHMADITLITHNADQFFQDYAHINEHSKMKFI